MDAKKVMIMIEELYNEHEFWYPYYRLKEAGVEVVVDGKFITSREPNDLPAFMRAVIEAL